MHVYIHTHTHTVPRDTFLDYGHHYAQKMFVFTKRQRDCNETLCSKCDAIASLLYCVGLRHDAVLLREPRLLYTGMSLSGKALPARDLIYRAGERLSRRQENVKQKQNDALATKRAA